MYYLDIPNRATKRLAEGVSAKTFWGEQMLLSVVDLEPHAVVPLHSHPHEQAGVVIEGELTFTIGGETRLYKTGEMYIIPGGVEHTVVAGDERAVALDVFSPVREDYKY